MADGDDLIAIELTSDERSAVNLAAALGPFESSDRLAQSLGFTTAAELESESDRMHAATTTGGPLSFSDWQRLIGAVHRLMSPSDSEWQTVTGLDYLETATLLDAVNRKVDLAWGGTRNNPLPHGSFRHRRARMDR